MKLPPYTKTAILVAIALAVGLQQGGGTAIVLIAPVLVACSIYAAVRLVWKRTERRARAVQIAAWTATLAIVIAVQGWWSSAAKDRADAAARAVMAHRQKTGAWPATLGDAGLDDASLKSDWRIRYRVRDGRPELAYPSQTMMMSSHEFDFESGRWKLNVY